MQVIISHVLAYVVDQQAEALIYLPVLAQVSTEFRTDTTSTSSSSKVHHHRRSYYIQTYSSSIFRTGLVPVRKITNCVV
jgi:hypothetical protein